jgi:ATP phosphoribosyltransferase regulatory subunit
VLNTLGDSLEKTRSPMQIGAELYGHSSIESDYEIICLMLETLALSQLQHVHLDLGHVALYRALTQQAELSDDQEAQLFEILQRKAVPELHQLLADWHLTAELKAAFAALPTLNGDRSILTVAAKVLPVNNAAIQQALADLQCLAEQLARDFPALSISFDLAELRGYHYHTGLVFAAFIPGVGKEIARGGRYDNIGAVFGRARAATGFSADLHQLSRLSPKTRDDTATIVFAPADNDPDLALTVRDLRADGTIVIQQLSNQAGSAQDMGCNAILEKHEHHWLVKPLTQG